MSHIADKLAVLCPETKTVAGEMGRFAIDFRGTRVRASRL